MKVNIKNLKAGVEFTNIKNYPTNQPFHPPDFFPEYKGENIDKTNKLYSKIRLLLFHLGLDAENYNLQNWNPFGSFSAGLLFGFFDALASKMAILKVPIPSEVMLMFPYLATMVILAGVVGRGQMPAADGQPYEKE